MDAFSRALEFTLRWEGGYVNHPADPGGETNFGVTTAVYSQYRKDKGLAMRSIRQISAVEVREIYHLRYWYAAGCDKLPPSLALCHFDWAVNSGCSRAIKTLQQVVGVRTDGIIGPLTSQAIISAISLTKETWLCDRYNAIREGCYRRWGVGSQRVFLAGWLNRLNAVKKAVNA